MKQKHIAISIPDPCQEDWEAMSASGRGRHCGACLKTVIDFTLMSDGQIRDIFNKSNDHPLCGRFLESQLDRELVDTRRKITFRSILFNKVAASVILLQSVATAVAAQEKKQEPTTQSDSKSTGNNKNKTEAYGRLFNHKTGDPIPNAMVSIQGTDISCVTGANGGFALPLPETFHSDIIIQYPAKDDGNPSFQKTTIHIADIQAGKEIKLMVADTTERAPVKPINNQFHRIHMGIPIRPIERIVPQPDSTTQAPAKKPKAKSLKKKYYP